MDANTPDAVPPPGCPAHAAGGRIPLYGPEFAADPHAYYTYLRHYGPTAPVELAPGVDATLVTDYATALRLLQDNGAFRKDARRWRAFNEGLIPPDSPVVPLLAYRPNAMFSDGVEHLRLRQAITDTLARVDTRRLARSTEQISDYLISQFGSRGSVDLMADYAKQLPLFVFNELFGCPADIGDRILFGISGMFDGINAERAAEVLFGAVGELVALKRSRPGDDVTSWLMQHEARLTDEEMVYQLALLLGAGADPLRSLIGNTLHRILTHDEYAHQGGLIDEALDDTLWENPPVPNLAAHYPATDMEFAGHKFQAGDLIMVSFAAANTSPALTTARQSGSNRSHLAWSAGPHACPSKDPARQITMAAVENLLNKIPDVEPAVPENSLTWRPGPFLRGLTAFPARFTPLPPPDRVHAPGQAPAGEHTEQPGTVHKPEGTGRWSQFLNWLAG
ncbi:cytochrome P450 [Streptomyces sp. NPDC006458]|uniref:cytochrome P450 n=1 Tax=Streptomyces sp. NPDC006458 TaxID=3154302 RepID=UPI0033B22F74